MHTQSRGWGAATTSLLLLFSRQLVSDSLRPHGLQHTRPLSLAISWSLPKFMSIKLVMPSSHLILCGPLLLLPSTFPSIGVFSNESALRIRWPKYWSSSFSISPSNEYSGLTSFRIDWLDLLAVQGTLKSLLQHHSSKAFVLCLLYGPTLSHSYISANITIFWQGNHDWIHNHHLAKLQATAAKDVRSGYSGHMVEPIILPTPALIQSKSILQLKVAAL